MTNHRQVARLIRTFLNTNGIAGTVSYDRYRVVVELADDTHLATRRLVDEYAEQFRLRWISDRDYGGEVERDVYDTVMAESVNIQYGYSVQTRDRITRFGFDTGYLSANDSNNEIIQFIRNIFYGYAECGSLLSLTNQFWNINIAA